MTLLTFAYSPCPNDTYIFHAWSHGLLADAPAIKVTHADIDQTNEWAIANYPSFDLLKISYAALPYVHETYELLPCGGALGEGCGPLLLSHSQNQPNDFFSSRRKIAIPAERSTAFLLLRLFIAEQYAQVDHEFVVVPFHHIMQGIVDGVYDGGLVIHEARFTYQHYRLQLLVDLGDWWESSSGHLIPLGAIVARRTLGDGKQLTRHIRDSLRYAQSNPQQSLDYIRCHSQELSEEVIHAHIQLYVNEFSYDIGERGRQSIESLLSRAMSKQLIPSFDMASLWL